MTFEASTIICLVAGAIVAALLFFLCSFRTAGILQQENYKSGAFFKWYFRKGNMLPRRLSLLALALLLGLAVFNLCFSFLSAKGANAVSAIPFAGLCLLYAYSDRRYALKVPFKRTPRAVRLGVCYFIVLFLVSAGLGFGMTAADNAVGKEWMTLMRYLPFALVPLLFPFLLAAANGLSKAYEVPANRRFIRKAKRALIESPCLKIGVTGSFGKTSVKNFAAAILSVRYRVRVTPASFNTPIGIALDVNRGGLDCDIYLAEMGARKRGDITELCDMVCPDYGVVTGVCPQHLETFGSIGAIAEEKGVLARRAKKGSVLGVSAQQSVPENALCEGKDFAAEDIVCTADGTDFVLRITLPCMVFQSFDVRLTGEVLLGASLALGVAFLMCFLGWLAGKFLYNRYPYEKKSILQYGTLVNNSGFLGLPIVNSVLGDEAMLLATIFIIPNRIFMWTAGISIFTHDGDKRGAMKKVILNPCMIAVYLGLIRSFTGFMLPDFLHDKKGVVLLRGTGAHSILIQNP